MQKKTVFLLQETKEQNEELISLFRNDENFEVIGSATDGITGLAMISEKNPDYLISEIVLSGYDGISVIEKTVSLGLKTKVFVLSSLCREEVIKNVINAGAKYFMTKPYKFDLLRERLLSIDKEKTLENSFEMNERKSISLEEKISKIFINVGIPPHIKGYVFLREGVLIAVNEPDIINNITKKLYPMIGEKFQTTPSKVERAIRHAIEVAWNRGRIESINGILGVRAYVGQEKPTNGEFIALVADKMLLERA